MYESKQSVPPRKIWYVVLCVRWFAMEHMGKSAQMDCVTVITNPSITPFITWSILWVCVCYFLWLIANNNNHITFTRRCVCVSVCIYVLVFFSSFSPSLLLHSYLPFYWYVKHSNGVLVLIYSLFKFYGSKMILW